MKTTHAEMMVKLEEREREKLRREDELAEFSAHLNAASARWVELLWEFHETGWSDDPSGFLAYRCGITRREARELLRVGEVLQELPVIRAAFARGEVTLTKVRALTRVATPSCEQELLELAELLTASQLERALRAFRRIQDADVRERHELEFVSYHFEEDGSLYLRARLAAEDGTLLVNALDAARDRVVARQREERAAARDGAEERFAPDFHVSAEPRSRQVEALLELAEASLTATEEGGASGRGWSCTSMPPRSPATGAVAQSSTTVR